MGWNLPQPLARIYGNCGLYAEQFVMVSNVPTNDNRYHLASTRLEKLGQLVKTLERCGVNLTELNQSIAVL